MALGKWDPFSNISTLQDRINRLFDDAFPESTRPGEEMGPATWRPRVDIFETKDGVTIQVDLPGVEKEAVSVEIKENILIIKGQRLPDTTAEGEHYYRRERRFGNFQRSFAMRSLVTPDDIKASFKNGVLKINLPRPEKEKLRPVTVDIY